MSCPIYYYYNQKRKCHIYKKTSGSSPLNFPEHFQTILMHPLALLQVGQISGLPPETGAQQGTLPCSSAPPSSLSLHSCSFTFRGFPPLSSVQEFLHWAGSMLSMLPTTFPAALLKSHPSCPSSPRSVLNEWGQQVLSSPGRSRAPDYTLPPLGEKQSVRWDLWPQPAMTLPTAPWIC